MIETIDEHVVLAHRANWLSEPKLTRSWNTSVDASETGLEARASVRAAAWLTLKYEVLPHDHQETKMLSERIKAALRAGKMAVPFWGRGVPLSSNHHPGQRTLTVAWTHRFSAGSWVYVQTSTPALYERWDAVYVSSISGLTLNLAAEITNEYPAGTMVHPLLFGKPIVDSFQTVGSNRLRTEIGLQFDQRQISGYAEDDFGDYAVGPAGTLSGGYGWDGAWVFAEVAA